MNNIISILIEISITASILILVVLLIRKLFKNKISAVVKYSLWLIVLLRLFMPYSISSPISIMNIFDFNKLQTVNIIKTNPAQKINNDIGTEIVHGYIGNEQRTIDIKNAQTNGNARLDTSTVLISIWAVGIMIMTAYMLILNIVYLRKIHKNSKIFPSDKLLLLEKICTDLKIKKRIPVVVNDKISSPCLSWLLQT